VKKFRKVGHFRLNLFLGGDRINMKGKFRILGHIGLALFVAVALMLAVMPAAKVEAATAVTNAWVEFDYTSSLNKANDTTATNKYLVHFKPTTALSRGVDTVTVTWPDGSATMCGSTSATLAFTVGSSMTTSNVDFSTNYGTVQLDRSTAVTWTDCTASITCGGYRTKVTTPIDIAAGQDVWVRFDPSDGELESGSAQGSAFKVYVGTSKDTTPVLSSAFTLGLYVPTVLTCEISPATAGAAAQYTLCATTSASEGALTSGTSTVTVKFPVGTVLPSSISASNVQFSDVGTTYTAAGTAPVVDQNRRTVTATLSVTGITAGDTVYMRILSGAGITNPTIASTDDYKCMVRTTSDRQYFLQDDAHTVSAGTPTTVTVCNGEIGQDANTRYSDDATMINMYSSQIYVALTDANGNSKAPASAVTVTLSSSSGTGAFYWDDEVASAVTLASCTTVSVSIAEPGVANGETGSGDQIVYYMDSTAGTHTLTFTASDYTTTTWTFTVAPAVSLYDSSDNLVNTYGPTTAAKAAETSAVSMSGVTASKYASDYINDAITAAMPGDTVKLGDGTYEVDNNSYINLNETITLTSVNGASSTTIRNTEEIDAQVISVGATGTSTYPIIIDGLTFQRLRSGSSYDIDCAIRNTYGDYVTVRNCIFNYIIPDEGTDTESVIWFQAGSRAITSYTISNNTFNNCVGFNTAANRTGNIVFDNGGSSYNMTGVTVSGNTLTNCNGYGIAMGAGSHTNTATISNNTITNGYSSIALADNTASCSITGNTITGAYNYGIHIEGTSNTGVTIKNNTITGSAGYGIKTEENGAVVTIQYNDIYGNNSYAIQSTASTQDCKYNWYGSATGPAYTALSSATVTKSNPNGTGNKISDYVTYYPWLHKSRADVVADNASYQACTMKLISGWNTLSTPVQLIAAANSVDELIPSGMTIGYYYDATGWQQITTGYVLSPCDAVYLKMSAVTYVLFKFDASAFTTPSKDLAAGWNLISLAYLNSSGMQAIYGVASVLNTAANLPGYSQVISPSLNNDTQRDLYYSSSVTDWTFTYSSGQAVGSAHTMRAGLGYWVYMQNAATLAGFEITPIAPDLD